MVPGGCRVPDHDLEITTNGMQNDKKCTYKNSQTSKRVEIAIFYSPHQAKFAVLIYKTRNGRREVKTCEICISLQGIHGVLPFYALITTINRNYY